VRFDPVIAPAPWTTPSHASLLTSLLPEVVGANRTQPIPASIRTLGEAFRDAGFATGAVVNTVYLDRKYGFDQGFDEFERLEGAKNVTQSVDAALDFFRRHAGGRRFFLLHVFDVHGPYTLPPPYDGIYARDAQETDEDVAFLRRIHRHDYLRLEKAPGLAWLRAQYDAGVARVDHELGRLFAELEARGDYDDTLVVVTSDHGEAFFEQRIWVGHGLFLYDSELRIPLLMRFPSRFGWEGGTGGGPLSLIDVAPTLLEAAGLPALRGAQGQSTLPAIRAASRAPGANGAPERAVFGSSSNLGGTRFVRNDRWKYIEPIRIQRDNLLEKHLAAEPSVIPELTERIRFDAQLYDVVEDPDERSDLLQVRPEIAREMAARLGEQAATNALVRADLLGEPNRGPVDLSDAERRRLRELGYAE
jgi:arylsulfatase A-like enzyme